MHHTFQKRFPALLFPLLLAGGLLGVVSMVQPQPGVVPGQLERDVDSTRLHEFLSPDAVEAHARSLAELGNRFPGYPGHRLAQEWVRQHYLDHGLDYLNVENTFASPVTRRRELLDQNRKPLDDVDLYPFPVNSLQPPVTDPGGLTGELVLLTDELFLTRDHVEGAIGVVHLGQIPSLQDLNWTRYAQLGLRALILVHPEGIEAFPWERVVSNGAMQSALPLDFPRLAASQGLLNHLGETVTLHVTSRFEPIRAKTLIGVLRAPRPAKEALVFTVPYDHVGILSDYPANELQNAPLATHLALVEALSVYREVFQRDVIFVATGAQYAGFAGLDHLLRMIGARHTPDLTRTRLEQDVLRHRERLDQLRIFQKIIAHDEFLRSVEHTLRSRAGLAPADRRAWDDHVRYVLHRILFEMSETVLERRMAYETGDLFDLDRPEYQAFLSAQFALEDVATVAGLPLQRMLGRPAVGGEGKPFIEVYKLAERLHSRFEELAEFHKQRILDVEAGLAVHTLFAGYEDVTVFSPAFLSAPGDSSAGNRIGFVMGGPNEAFERNFRTISPTLTSSIQEIIRMSPRMEETVSFTRPFGGLPNAAMSAISNYPVPTQNWNRLGWKAFTLVQLDRATSYRRINFPDGSRFEANSMAPALAFTGEFALAWAQGRDRLPEAPLLSVPQASGQVYASDVGRSLIPNFPLSGALLAPKPDASTIDRSPGRREALHLFSDPYGRYELPDLSSTLWAQQFNLQCVIYDDAGRISHIKDEGGNTQNLYPSMNLTSHGRQFLNINLVAFRASPIAVLDLVNPQTLRPFPSVRFVRSGNLSDFDRSNTVTTGDGVVSFLPADANTLVTFRAGSPDNELVQTVRSFMGGADDPSDTRDREIRGKGYRVWDHTILTDVPREQAESLHRLNDGRLRMQEKRGLADGHTVTFHENSGELLEELDADSSSGLLDRIQAARDSLTYAMITHPILRGNIDAAVISILWYMGLLVPFLFFFEKLVFGFSDIRKQLLAQTVIFLMVFGLLRVLHPAFEMIRSSFMILLGFFILMISLGISILFMGKFGENLEDLRKKRGQVSSAKVNTLGVLGTAFMLGLNNMHRRKVRTGLTCGTLVLITFAMICFTSIHNDFFDNEYPIGPAAYQGLLVKNEKFAEVTQTERFAIESAFSRTHQVAPRLMVLGVTRERELLMPELQIRRELDGGRVLAFPFDSIVSLSPNEPLRHRFRFVSNPYWFDAAELKDSEEDLPVLLPESLAARLNVRIDEVNAGGVPVEINGRGFIVKGVFDEDAYLATLDLDGRPLLPFDVRALSELELVPRSIQHILADENSPRVDVGNIIIAPVASLGITIGNSENRRVSVAIDFADSVFREARTEIIRFLEMRARPVYYGLDGTSYLGSRMRVSNFEGLVDLVIPLLIAALTVLNTMRGSVYERRDEIFVYNAVGIAPRFIFFMFFAEAFVYAVVGSVCGYLLSQGTGTILTALDLTGGLNMTFAGTNTIYASLAVVAAVFLSTWFPAKSAMEIAAPAEEAGWTPPVPEGDGYAFNLPFTFNHAERTAVLAFFRLYLLDHGEGGGGPFSAAPPRFGVEEAEDGETVPTLETVIWLQPFDLGVSQKIVLSTPMDPESGSFVARMTVTRLTGTREAWMRVTHGFLAKVRRQFLHWRSVPPEQKAELRGEARRQMELDWSLNP